MAIIPVKGGQWTIHVERSDGEKLSLTIDKVASYSHIARELVYTCMHCSSKYALSI